MTRVLHTFAFVVLIAMLAAPAVAIADPGAVIRDCSQDEQLDGKYSKSDLRWARDHLPTDIEEYTSCSEVIGAALSSGGNGSGRTAAAAAATATPTPEEQGARAGDQGALQDLSAHRRDPGAIEVGGHRVTPQTNGIFDTGSASNGLPLPLLLALIALGLLTLLGGFVALRSRVPALARISLPTRVRFPRPRG